MTVEDIYHFLNEKAPFSTAEEWDNTGLLVGDPQREVARVLTVLDITPDAVEAAQRLGAQLIVSHHPVIFSPLRRLESSSIPYALAQADIAAVCAHTNLDAVAGGVNDALARAVGLTEIEMLQTSGVDENGAPYGIGRVGVLKGKAVVTLADYAAQVKTALQANGVRYVDAGRPVRRVAVGGGACGDLMGDALAQGCDTFITSDVKYNGFLDARALGLNLIDAGHFPTENVICPVLAERLKRAFPGLEVQISAVHGEVFSYL